MTKTIPPYTNEQLTHIWRLFRYLGYDFPDISQVSKYLAGGYLNPDQQDAVNYATGNPNSFAVPSQRNANPRHIAAAKQIFGTTTDFDCAGYIVPDGDMLDFSEGQFIRTLDHRSIHQVFDGEEFATATAPLIQFMNEGSIRISCNGFDLSVPPTNAQAKQLARFIRQKGQIYMDISNIQGKEIYSRYYDHTHPADVLNDIEQFFTTLFP